MNIILTTKKFEDIICEYELKFFKNIKKLSNKKLLEKDNYFLNKRFYFHFEEKKIYFCLKKSNNEEIKIRFSNLSRELLKYKIKSIKIDLVHNEKLLDLQAVYEGLYLGNYEFLKYLKKEQKDINTPHGFAA